MMEFSVADIPINTNPICFSEKIKVRRWKTKWIIPFFFTFTDHCALTGTGNRAFVDETGIGIHSRGRRLRCRLGCCGMVHGPSKSWCHLEKYSNKRIYCRHCPGRVIWLLYAAECDYCPAGKHTAG